MLSHARLLKPDNVSMLSHAVDCRRARPHDYAASVRLTLYDNV